MRLNKKNQGSYIQYELNGSRISLRGGELTLDLAQLERDYAVHLDISQNTAGQLVMGPSYRYSAEIDIPARVYIVEKGEADDLGFPKLTRRAVPLDMEKVELTLWAGEV
jgi:hypothetical protein